MISINPFTLKSAEDMVSLFSLDDIIRMELGLDKTEFSAEEEFRFVSEWCKNKSSESFEIRFENEFAGMISLSHIDPDIRKAGVGYWVGSKFRNRGIGKKAFEIILDIAKSKGLEILQSDIDRNNLFSLKIWQKYSPEISEKNEKQVSVKIKI
ncbi:MAG: GNAT family N-acetyltransferase [Candidatus Delongbacteria bacterium]|nr:GNAT family N-acetyltransferase [Candidatus Delongbacteria bacterium]